MIALLIKSLVI